MSLQTTERLPGVNPGDLSVEGVGTLKLDVTLRDAGADPRQILDYRTPSGKATIAPGHPYYKRVEQAYHDPASLGLRAEAAAGGNIANMGAYYTAVGVHTGVNAFYDPSHPTAVTYTRLAERHGVPLDPVVVPSMPVATNLIVRHNGERQVFRYVPYEVPIGEEHIDELVSRVAGEEHLVVVTSAGALAAHAAIMATPRDTLLAYTPGRELDNAAAMRDIGAALRARYDMGGLTLMSLNKEEAQATVGAPEHVDVVTLAREIGRHELAQTVYITDGPAPSVMAHGNDFAQFWPPYTRVEGTSTGAGDRGAAFVALRASVTADWTPDALYETQEAAYREVLPVLAVDTAMGDLPVYEPNNA